MVNEVELRAALRPSINRDRAFLGGAATIAVAITIAAIMAPSTQARGPETLFIWFAGCAVFAVIGRAWYRWHRTKCEQMLAAALAGDAVRNVAIARFTINWIIPFGHVVALDVGTLRNLNVAFWWRRDAERFVAAIGGTGELPNARVLRS